MDAREILYWHSLLSGPEELGEDCKISVPEAHEILRKHLLNHGFEEGIIQVPALRLEVELERDEFYLLKEVKDPAESADFMHQVGNPEYIHKKESSGPHSFYAHMDYEGRGVYTWTNILLLRKGLGAKERETAECHLCANFLYTTRRREMVYERYGTAKEAQKVIKSRGDFVKFCERILQHK